MSNGTNDTRVRPLRDDGHVRRDNRPPGFAIVVGLLAVGGLVGWVGASANGPSIATSTTNPAVQAGSERALPPEPAAAVSVEWAKAEAIPRIPTGMEYGGFSAVAELGGHIYATAVFVDVATGAETSELWGTATGLDWTASTIDVGEPMIAQGLVAVGDGLLLTGRTGDTMAMWRSTPGRTIGGSSWSKVHLEIPQDVHGFFLGTAVNSSGEIMATIVGNLEIWAEVVEPYLPPGVDLGDPHYTYNGDEFLYAAEPPGQIRLFAEPPEVVVAADRVWVRIVTLDGEEALEAFALPAGTYSAGGSATLDSIPLLMAWVSDNGLDFLPVTGDDALPRGFVQPEPWGDRFVGAVYNMEQPATTGEMVTLWGSPSGRAWHPEHHQAPAECSPYLMAISGERMYLTSEEGTQCIRDVDSEWEVLDAPSTAAYVVGGGAGFVGYPDSFEYDTAIFSRDGISWSEISIPTPEPYPGIMVLEDRLLTLSVSRPGEQGPSVVEIWLGEISS